MVEIVYYDTIFVNKKILFLNTFLNKLVTVQIPHS